MCYAFSSNRSRCVDVHGLLRGRQRAATALLRKYHVLVTIIAIFSLLTWLCSQTLELDRSGMNRSTYFVKPRYDSLHRTTNFCHIDKRVTNIYFLKVTKCGSTTLGTILTRFASGNNLTIALPSAGLEDPYHIGWPESLQPKHFYEYEDHRPINLVALHTVYNRTTVRRIMPRGFKSIAILRDPFRQLWSAFDFFKYAVIAGIDSKRPLKEFLRYPRKYDRPLQRYYGKKYLQNFYLTEFGYPDRHETNLGRIDDFLSELDRDFSIVLILELFPESVVLMRRLFCWSFMDILSVNLNVNRDKHEVHLLPAKKLYKLHKVWSSADYHIYEHFRKKLEHMISEQGDDFFDEVTEYKKATRILERFCTTTDNNDYNLTVKIPSSLWNDQITISGRDCMNKFRRSIYEYHFDAMRLHEIKTSKMWSKRMEI